MRDYSLMMDEREQYKFASFEERLAKFQDMIDKASNIVFFGGAGVSTESGIPDFRSKDGLYNQKDVNFDMYEPEYLLSRNCLYNNPTVFFEYYRQKLDCRKIEPNTTHLFLAELEKEKKKEGKFVTVVTQNIDGLHQKAGSTVVREIHGTTTHNYCTYCGGDFDKDYIFESDEKIPKCPDCGKGMVRPDVTLYGESLPEDYHKSETDIDYADLMIVAGTSLSVFPAAELALFFKGPIVIINRDETVLDNKAVVVFREGLGEVFSQLRATKKMDTEEVDKEEEDKYNEKA